MKKRIIGLGEATHGQLKINKWRSKMIKKLIEKDNFNVIVLEEQYSCVKILDKYIKNRIEEYRGGIGSFQFMSTTFIKLLKWLRKYNIKTNNKISMIGIDCQYWCSKYKSESKISKYVKRKIKNNKKKNERDKNMYDIFMKQHRESKKYIILAHNGHLQKKKYYEKDDRLWLGNYLSKRFKTEYYVIGNTFYNGKYHALDIDNDNKLSIAKIRVKKELEDGLYKEKDLFEKTYIYEGSMIYSSKNPKKTFYKFLYANRFDELIVINNEVPFEILK
jgi:erythromycin esterase-like protein